LESGIVVAWLSDTMGDQSRAKVVTAVLVAALVFGGALGTVALSDRPT
jgi:hypothetical protein